MDALTGNRFSSAQERSPIARISSEELEKRLNAGESVFIVDLRQELDAQAQSKGGAMTHNASRGAMLAAALLTQACTGGTMAGAPSAPAAAGAPSDPSYGIYGYDSYFKLEWQPDERRGKPLVSGYVGNQWGFPVRNVRLRVEALDGAGNVTANTIGYVNGTVIPGSRVYFEVPVAEKAPGYRVRMLSFDAVQGHGP